MDPGVISLQPPPHVEYQNQSLYEDEGIIDIFDIPCQQVPSGTRSGNETPESEEDVFSM